MPIRNFTHGITSNFSVNSAVLRRGEPYERRIVVRWSTIAPRVLRAAQELAAYRCRDSFGASGLEPAASLNADRLAQLEQPVGCRPAISADGTTFCHGCATAG
jgi:hypothetical protein